VVPINSSVNINIILLGYNNTRLKRHSMFSPFHDVVFEFDCVESSWNVMAHGDAGRGSEGETGEWSGYPVFYTLPRNMVYAALLPLMSTPRLPVVDWTDAPAVLNGLVHFAERWNLGSARVPSHIKRSLTCWSNWHSKVRYSYMERNIVP